MEKIQLDTKINNLLPKQIQSLELKELLSCGIPQNIITEDRIKINTSDGFLTQEAKELFYAGQEFTLCNELPRQLSKPYQPLSRYPPIAKGTKIKISIPFSEIYKPYFGIDKYNGIYGGRGYLLISHHDTSFGETINVNSVKSISREDFIQAIKS